VRDLADLIFEMGEKLPDADYKKALDLCSVIHAASSPSHRECTRTHTSDTHVFLYYEINGVMWEDEVEWGGPDNGHRISRRAAWLAAENQRLRDHLTHTLTHSEVVADAWAQREAILCASEKVLDLRQEIEQLKVNQIETENQFGIISDAWVAEQAKVAELDAKLNKALAENLPHSY
jgi:hypothetical protein